MKVAGVVAGMSGLKMAPRPPFGAGSVGKAAGRQLKKTTAKELEKGAAEELGARVTVKESKWNYFFGRVKSSAHNESRSLQNVKDLETLGIEEGKGGRERLMELFESGLSSPEKGKLVAEYGTTITKTVEVPPNGAIDIKYFYPGGDMSAIPEISTIIPKIYKYK